jgi:hypothetical protein
MSDSKIYLINEKEYVMPVFGVKQNAELGKLLKDLGHIDGWEENTPLFDVLVYFLTDLEISSSIVSILLCRKGERWSSEYMSTTKEDVKNGNLAIEELAEVVQDFFHSFKILKQLVEKYLKNTPIMQLIKTLIPQETIPPEIVSSDGTTN